MRIMSNPFKKIKMEQIIMIAVVFAILACCMFVGSCIGRNRAAHEITHQTRGTEDAGKRFIYLETREFLDPSGNTIYAVSFLDTETGMASDAVAYSEAAYIVIMGFLGEEITE